MLTSVETIKSGGQYGLQPQLNIQIVVDYFIFECNYVYITEGVEKEKVATTVKGSGGSQFL